MKSITRILHLPSGVQSEFYEATRILFICKENNCFFLTIRLFSVSPRHHSAILEIMHRRKQRTFFCIRLNPGMRYVHENQSVNTCRICILVLRRIQKSVHCLRSVHNLQNGATVTRRDRGDEMLKKIYIFFFFAYKRYSRRIIQFRLNPDGRWTSLAMIFILVWTSTMLFTWQSMGQSQASRFLSKISVIVFRRRTKLLWSWNDMRVNDKWQHFHFVVE